MVDRQRLGVGQRALVAAETVDTADIVVAVAVRRLYFEPDWTFDHWPWALCHWRMGKTQRE